VLRNAEIDAAVGRIYVEATPLPVIAGEGDVQAAVDRVAVDVTGDAIQGDAAVRRFETQVAIDSRQVDATILVCRSAASCCGTRRW